MLLTKIQTLNRIGKIKFKLFFESARRFYFCAMNQSESESNLDPIRAALDHFISDVFPTLFKGKSTTDPNYKRVYALISERRKELACKPSKLNDDWIIRLLTEFAPDKYQFNRVTTVTINTGKDEPE